MSWSFNNDLPIYVQIMDEIKLRIAKEEFKPGDRIPAVRELAVMAGVNPNTMQKALVELEREGVLCSERTSGRFVSEASQNAALIKEKMSLKYVASYVESMTKLGFKKEDLIRKIEEYVSEGEL